ncbi:MAG: hypothetical protein D6768_02675 [Chloroflexi bacterium]|nr:MAG: hypothetical protein D6768_02675 [Chloroflexota bacterium]
MNTGVTGQSIRQFSTTVSNSHHAMAGAVIAASAAQAASLGYACMKISLAHGAQNVAQIAPQIKKMGVIQSDLLDLCDRDATAIAEFVAHRDAGQVLKGQTLLCRMPADVCQLSINAAQELEAFRGQVSEQVRDDMEMAISLLAAAARAALLLLDSNLRIWPEPALLQKFEPELATLETQIEQLTPVQRIRRQSANDK